MKVEEIVEAIRVLFSFKIKSEDADVVIYNTISDKTAILYKTEIEKIITQLNDFESYNDIELFNNNTYEVITRTEKRLFVSKSIEQKDLVNKIEYTITKPTDRYLVFFIYNLHKQNAPNILRGAIFSFRLRRIYDNKDNTTIPEINILNLIKEIIPRLETLQLKSETVKKKQDFEQLVYSFLFNLGYNMDSTILPLRFMDEFIQPYRIGSFRKGAITEIEPPKRLYINELILHYQKGISSESIDHQFLSFYHVIEHFFEKIYNDDILNNVRNELTKPNFSYKRSKDITNLIAIIQNRLKYKNDEFLINELEALELTLKKFMKDTLSLKLDIQSISPQLINYYRTEEVPFSKGNKVDFESKNTDEIIKNLAKRIYFTRNSIVHSKETEKLKYIPFRDDKDLINEIYLMRLIAEIIIIENSKEL